MKQEGACVLAGAPVENNATAAIDTGTAENGRVTFTLTSRTYEGAIAEPDRTMIEGTVECTGGITMRGTWRAVR